MKNLKINLFGGLTIYQNGKEVLTSLEKSRKTDLLIEYLILKRGRNASHEDLIGALWSERESRNPATALRTLLHRFRRLAEQEGVSELQKAIITTRGAYRWNMELDCDIDILEFEKAALRARTLEPGCEEQLELYRRMVYLYKAPLLAESTAQKWLMPLRTYYHDLYLEAVYRLVESYRKEGEIDRIVHLCGHAITIDPYDARLQSELSLAREEQHPSGGNEELKSLCGAIAETCTMTERDISTAKRALEWKGAGDDALQCDHNTFRSVYLLQKRLLAHPEMNVFLGLVTLVRAEGIYYPEDAGLEGQMDMLLKALRDGLGDVDVLSRYSRNQFILLVPAIDRVEAFKRLDRAKRIFYAMRGDAPIMLTMKMVPINE